MSHMVNYFKRTLLFLLVAILATTSVLGVLFPQSASAASETYAWINERNIGAFNGSSLIRTYTNGTAQDLLAQTHNGGDVIEYTTSVGAAANGSICADTITGQIAQAGGGLTNNFYRVTRTEVSGACQQSTEKSTKISIDTTNIRKFFTGNADGSLTSLSGRTLKRVEGLDQSPPVYVEYDSSTACPAILFENSAGVWGIIAGEPKANGDVVFDSQGRTKQYQAYLATAFGADTYGGCQIGGNNQKSYSTNAAASLLGGTGGQWTNITGGQDFYTSIKPGDTNHDAMPFGSNSKSWGNPIAVFIPTASKPATNCNIYMTAYELTACKQGLNNSGATYCTDTYPPLDYAGGGTYQDRRAACIMGQTITKNGGPSNPTIQQACGSGGTACAGANSKSCVVDGIGWLICGFTSFIADVADNVYSLIENILKVPVINTDTSSGTNGVFNAWTIMRNLANVVFVIMFLIIIFAQLTGQGVSNYGVKKTLPRLVVAAILVNVSFWLSAVVVDLSNIIGSGLYDLLRGVVNSMNVGISTNWGNLLGALLGGTTLAGTTATVGVAATVAAASIPGIGGALLFLAIPLVLGAMLAVLTVAVVLVARQALVIILIIISPLAFVALLLPNTEGLFKRWRTTLTSLLLMYPIVSIVFGGAQIAGFAILSTAAHTTDPLTTWIAIITGQFVIVAPFFFLPTILIRFSGGNLDKLAANIQSRGQKLIGGIGGASRKAGNERLGRGFNQAKYGHDNGASGLRSNFRRMIGTAGRTYDRNKDINSLTDANYAEERKKATNAALFGPDGRATQEAIRAAGGGVAEGQRLADRARAGAEAEALKKALEPLGREIAQWRAQGKNVDDELEARFKDGSGAYGEMDKVAALHKLGEYGRDGVIRKLQTEFKDDVGASQRIQEAIQANGGALASRAPDLVKGPEAAFSGVTGNDLASFSKDTMGTYMQYLQDLEHSDTAAFAKATQALGTAVADIAANPTLQGGFKQDAGAMLSTGVKGSTAIAAAVGTHLQPDGKIR